MIAAKVQSSQAKVVLRRKKQHVLFEDVPAAKNSEASDYRKTTKEMWLENDKLPDYRIGKKCQRNESVFSKISTRPDAC